MAKFSIARILLIVVDDVKELAISDVCDEYEEYKKYTCNVQI